MDEVARKEKYEEIINDAPTVDKYLCDDCKKHLSLVERSLKQSQIKYSFNP